MNFTLPNPFKSTPKPFKGKGNSLGGPATPPPPSSFTTHPITFVLNGTLGMTVSRNERGGCIVTTVESKGQAGEAGVCANDVICDASDHIRDVSYEEFMVIAKAGVRPLDVVFKRFSKGGDGETNRKIAMINAATKRENKAKSNSKPISKYKAPSSNSNSNSSLASTNMNTNTNTKQYDHTRSEDEPLTLESKLAIEHAKSNEVAAIGKLGYNPYESSSVNSNRTGAMKASAPDPAPDDENENENAVNDQMNTMSLKSKSAQVKAKAKAQVKTVIPINRNALNQSESESEIQALLKKLKTSTQSPLATKKIALTTMKTLLKNAISTAKGQSSAVEVTSLKFRTIKLSNESIQRKVMCCEESMELLIGFGFVFDTIAVASAEGEGEGEGEDEDEMVLVFPLTPDVDGGFHEGVLVMIDSTIKEVEDDVSQLELETETETETETAGV